MRLSFAALASTKLASTENASPAPIPHCRTICSNSLDCGNRPRRLLENVVWNLLIETQARETSPSQMHPQLFHQLALLGSDAKRALADVHELQTARILYQMLGCAEIAHIDKKGDHYPGQARRPGHRGQ
jgi:hypothetical protein